MVTFRPTLRESLLSFGVLVAGIAIAAPQPFVEIFASDKFRQLDEIFPTPNSYRTASGAPGHDYWQQQVDYEIDVSLNEEIHHIDGSEWITYHNNSPDTLRYLWVQLDPNIYAPESHASTTRGASDLSRISYQRFDDMMKKAEFDGRCNITRVDSIDGSPLDHTIVDTVMRIDLARPLAHGESTRFRIDWDYAINNHDVMGGRSGYELFKEDGNAIYEMAQWFPRLCVYSDATGWQTKAFLGSGEFTLQFGDYRVRIDVPSDHIVAATGVLQNRDEVLNAAQRDRLAEAAVAAEPLFIVTPEEAKGNEAERGEGRKVWLFHAENVRDFSWASSRKFIWDAKLHRQAEGAPVWCMSFYPNEAEPLWSHYSTHAIMHTIDVYSKHTFPYPYPVAISVNGPVGGMEYPMICFNGPRPEKDGTYSERTKYGLISVVIHEVGHNYFPMIVNSDERQWTWMDEGLNTFLQFLAEEEWEKDYPSRRGEPKDIVGYMKSENQVPIMTASDSLVQFGSNGYAKPATALNVLRETVLGRDLFDFAFKEYATRWEFKHPMPADFFRTLEDASGVDLDWFWRGWFYTIEKCDVALDGVKLRTIDSRDPDVEKVEQKKQRDDEPITLTKLRNRDLETRLDRFPNLGDFYNEYDELTVTDADRDAYQKLIAGLDEKEVDVLKGDLRFYEIGIRNVGGLVTPVTLRYSFDDGSCEDRRIPAEVWRRNNDTASNLLVTSKTLVGVEVDPFLESPDVDRSNNSFPPKIDESKFQLQSNRDRSGSNPMRDAKKAADAKAKGEAERLKKEEEAKEADGADGAIDATPQAEPNVGAPPVTPPVGPNAPSRPKEGSSGDH